MSHRADAGDGLAPHPEGGSYRETWRATSPIPAGRSPVTAIDFLLAAGETSRWHRLHLASELWVWNGGGRLRLSIGGTGPQPAETREVILGPGAQHLVAPGEWQAAEPVDAAVRAVCIVSPGFDYDDFELTEGDAPPTNRISVLLVCEGNMCRSPSAEVLLQAALASRGATGVSVSSAGLRTEPGLRIESKAAFALKDLGLAVPNEFRTRRFGAKSGAVDLILTATVAQRDQVVSRLPSAREHTFSWREALALARDWTPSPQPRINDLIAHLRSGRGLVQPDKPGDFDTEDPIGRSTRFFERTASLIAADMDLLADLLAAVVR